MDGWVDPRLEGVRALAREEIDQAVTWLERAVEELPDDPDAHAYLGCALLAAGDIARGRRETDRALELAPEGFASNVKSGELAIRTGDPARAADHFLKALRAAAPGSRDAAAAKALLSEARRRSRASIPHHASLPSLHLAWWRGRRRKELAQVGVTGEAGGTIA